MRQLALVAMLHVCAAGQSTAQACSAYEPAVVSLKGTLAVRTFPGGAHSRDTMRGDEPERTFLLELDHPICIEPDSSSSLYNDARRGVRQIQLAVVGDSVVLALRRLVGHRIAVTGELFSAETGHHHTAILLLVRDVRGLI